MGVPTDIEVLASSLSPQAITAFRQDVEFMAIAFDEMQKAVDIPDIDVDVVLADDFAGEVNRRTHEMHQPRVPFTVDRAGAATVVGKNLPQSDDASAVAIVFNAVAWSGDLSLTRGRVAGIVAHELAHPLLQRAARASGALDGVIFPSETGTELARSSARVMAGEYQADRIADALVGRYISVNVDGEARPYTAWMYEGANYLEGLYEAFLGAYPMWPDLVDSYRNWKIDLMAMFAGVGMPIDQSLTLVVHTQAMADAADARLDILADPGIARLPAVALYIADPFAPFLEELRKLPFLPTLEQARDIERLVVSIGADMTFEIWRRLGLHPVETVGTREWELNVTEPMR